MSSRRVPATAGTVVRAADRPGLTVPSVLPRPLAAGETGTVERVFAGLSAESRRLRFLAAIRACRQTSVRRPAAEETSRTAARNIRL